MNRGFTGTVNLQLNDLIQMVCLARSDLSIRVRSALGSGTILVQEGEIRHAHTETIEGEAAFFEILRWKDGQFEFSASQEVPVKSVNKPWEHLLLEAMRRRDEEAVESHQAVLADFEETYSDVSGNGELEQEIDFVFDQLERTAREFSEEIMENLEEPSEETRALKVLVVDDSPFFARQLQKMLEEDPGIKVVASVRNGKEALDFLSSKPHLDCITLDAEMPVMQGDTTLKHIMIRHPIPVISISSLQPDSLAKIFEFLQVGAVDFFPKPHAKDDIELYGNRLRQLVFRASKAHVSHFRRWRKQKLEARAIGEEHANPMDKTLIVVGAEGAHMDWFRLPLRDLYAKGTLLGLQQMAEHFLPQFCRLIEECTAARSKPLAESALLEPGSLNMAIVGRPMDFRRDPAEPLMEVGSPSAETLPWEDGVARWLTPLAHEFGHRLSIYFLSGASPLPPDLISPLIDSGARLILAASNTVMCTELVDSIHPYALLYPRQILWGKPDNLLEVWLDNELNS